MGSGYTKTCPKCGFKFHSSTGIGYMFPLTYRETVQKARDGGLGKELQSFFKEHTDGAIDAEYVNLCCEKCGHLDCGMDLTMYVPDEKKMAEDKQGRGDVEKPHEDTDYVMRDDLEEYYTEFAKYPHTCKKCGGSMRILKEDEELVCPECKVPLKTADMIMWD